LTIELSWANELNWLTGTESEERSRLP
jgi:hypothetical protein